MKNKINKCPKCNEEYKYPAISRADNKTEICSICGETEAIAQYKDYNVELKPNTLTPLEKEVRKQVVKINIEMNKMLKRFNKERNDERSRIGQKKKQEYLKSEKVTEK